MGRMFKAILVLILLAVLGTVGYAYFGDMNAEPTQMRSPVTLPDLAPPQAVAPAAPASVPGGNAAPAAVAPPATGAEPAAPQGAVSGAGLDD